MGHPFRHSRIDDGGWRPAAAMAVVVILAVHVLWTLMPPLDGAAAHWAANVFTDTSVAVALVFVTLVALRYRGSRLGTAWTLLAVGLVFSLFAEVSWSAQEMLIDEDVPFPSVSDIGYVGAYFPLLLGLLLMPQAPASRASKVKLALDALIVTFALAVLSWLLIAEKILSSSGEPFGAKAVSVFYPFADLAVVFAAFVLVARSGRRFALSFGLLAAGYVATAFSDSVYAYVTEAGYSSGSYADIGWVAGYALMSLAALTALDPMAALESPSRQGEPAPAFWPSLAPYGAMLPLSVLLLDRSVGDRVDPTLTVGFLAIVFLIVLRQVLSSYENVLLNRELRDLNANLENRVREKTMQLLRRRPCEDGEDGDAAGGRPSGADEQVGGLRPFQRQ